ncbi:cobalamin biosynthesis protein CobD [Facklamia sp. DSM 111018]|uniref:Cobalamin biosynthesis protein CobD n=1 Tax=Facklamia lactis TaxID=2749967 RepID=A0ABS0LP21_9LACT|nr:adenosylcobinamide-phosphate synthase CbiB [Facklamia lactis]MBG9980113.1 cobalamin biosynthesis protein CobD [Facklamia lactis]MBG9985915.1 cobalamin biosynthesis protein CobD [Facklamia lactis]
MDRIVLILIAILLDLLFGDPYSWPHPVKFMGNYIYYYLDRFEDSTLSYKKQFLRGVYLWVSLCCITMGILSIIFIISKQIHPYLSNLIAIYCYYSSFSVRSLAREAKKVQQALLKEGIVAGRQQVSMIVGRETHHLSEDEVIQATIETVAENTSDGFVAPLIYSLLGGPYLTMLYKMINTLDSMVAYKNERFNYLGRFSAKVDDIFNYIPARVSAILIIIASFLCRYSWRKAWEILKRDCYRHASPNAGFPEAAAAGALRIRLGGGHYYHGVYVDKPWIGDDDNRIVIEDISKIINLLYCIAALIFVVLFMISYLKGALS